MRQLPSFAVLLLLLVLPGCIFSPKEEPQDPDLPTQLIPNDTPENTVRRFIQVYELGRSVEYEQLFTGDFVFEFSNAADPTLVQKFSAGWYKEDEKISSRNLFEGGVNQDGVYQEAAVRIEVELLQVVPTDDNSAGRDGTVYKTLYTPVRASIEVPGDLTYEIGQTQQQFNRFFLVRGDYAVGLTPEQPADDTHWYIWNWRDESPPLTKPTVPGRDLGPALEGGPAEVSWGALKALTR
jgi:hypothetical protein